MTDLERAWTAEQNLAAMTLRYEMANRLNISARQELAEVKGFILNLLESDSDDLEVTNLSSEQIQWAKKIVKGIK